MQLTNLLNQEHSGISAFVVQQVDGHSFESVASDQGCQRGTEVDIHTVGSFLSPPNQEWTGPKLVH